MIARLLAGDLGRKGLRLLIIGDIMSTYTYNAELRTETGTGASRRLRPRR